MFAKVVETAAFMEQARMMLAPWLGRTCLLMPSLLAGHVLTISQLGEHNRNLFRPGCMQAVHHRASCHRSLVRGVVVHILVGTVHFGIQCVTSVVGQAMCGEFVRA